MQANKILHEDIMSRGSVEDLEILNSHLDLTIQQLSFWEKENNKSRYIYDLRSHAEWMLKYFH